MRLEMDSELGRISPHLAALLGEHVGGDVDGRADGQTLPLKLLLNGCRHYHENGIPSRLALRDGRIVWPLVPAATGTSLESVLNPFGLEAVAGLDIADL